ncbi:MAG: hypothetical protein M3406_01065 [Chloroflexota bacterium]|nr:hypothetical protein [Chloroflexota bacterium]
MAFEKRADKSEKAIGIGRIQKSIRGAVAIHSRGVVPVSQPGNLARAAWRRSEPEEYLY